MNAVRSTDKASKEAKNGPLGVYELLSSLAASLRTAEYATPVLVRGVYRRRAGREWNGFWYDRLVDEDASLSEVCAAFVVV